MCGKRGKFCQFPIDKVYIGGYHISMNTTTISATAARNKFFEILNQVAMGKQFIIEKDSKEVAMITPSKVTKTDWVSLRKASKAVHGIFKDLSVEEINPLSKKGAWKGFGEWDKDLKIKAKKK